MKMDFIEAKIDTFCTSMQSDNKRKRDQEDEAGNKRRPSQEPRSYCKLCKRSGHTTARWLKKCHSCLQQQEQYNPSMDQLH